MPFAVFRRHQRKLLAIFAILAMFGFVLADSLPRLLSGGYGGRNQNPPVVTLYDRTIYRGELNQMAQQRNVANQFMAELIAAGEPLFGDLKRPVPGRRADPPARGRPAGHADRPGGGSRMAQADVRPAHEPRDVRGHPQPPRPAGQRRAGPQRHRQPGPAAQGPAVAGRPDGDPTRRLPGLPRPERARLGPRGQLPRRGLPREGPRPVVVGAGGVLRSISRTSCPTRPAIRPDSRSPARSGSRSSRSMATPWRAGSRIS